jgi:lysyl-tRNA synthetase class 1
MNSEHTSNFWLDIAADEILRRHPDGEIIVSSGISPSASYHIGHFREIMTAEALAWAVRQRGRTARHLHVVDNIDPLRKWYDFLPKTDKDYSGWPVALIPDPYGDCHASYADHFYAEFTQQLAPMGIQPEIIRSYEELYKTNRMTKYIEQALEHTQQIKKVFEELSNRELPEEWTSVWVLDQDHKFQKGELSTWDSQAKTINGLSYENGNAKLDWRLDWPARWVELGVNVEPFGAQEHGASGGSYDTGKLFVENVFHGQAPYDAVQYGHIHRPGENIKMSSSKGNGVTPQEALQIMPAEILRYFIVRSRPEKKIFFDPGIGLYNLIDEFAAAQADPNHEFRDAYNFAVAGGTKQVISSISFKHLVSVYQAAQGDVSEALQILRRTGYDAEVDAQKDIITAEFTFVKNWLGSYAPDEVKFTVLQQPPKVELSPKQQAFLSDLALRVERQAGDIDGQAMHLLIYAAKDAAELAPKEAFQALYRTILGKDYGPKAGWFLSSLDRDWLTRRLKNRS